jgi:hypothetical protein
VALDAAAVGTPDIWQVNGPNFNPAGSAGEIAQYVHALEEVLLPLTA